MSESFGKFNLAERINKFSELSDDETERRRTDV